MVLFHKQKTLSITPTIEDYRNNAPHPARLEGGMRKKGKFQKISEPERPLVSVITIVRNGEATLEQTITSVLNQTYNNIEYIIVDGNSSDSTLDIICKYENEIAYWVSEPDQGVGDAFNKGISLSTGDIIGIINSDDWYNDLAIEQVVQAFLSNSSEIFHGKVQYWNKDNTPYYVFSAREDKLEYYMSVSHPTMFVCRAIYERLGLYDLKYRNAMDYEWASRLKLSGKNFYYLNSIISNMRLKGLSDQDWIQSYSELAEIRCQHGMSKVQSYFILIKMVTITFARKSLENIGLDRLVRIYRKYFSVVKKDIV